jgi:hypothetical protein
VLGVKVEAMGGFSHVDFERDRRGGWFGQARRRRIGWHENLALEALWGPFVPFTNG